MEEEGVIYRRAGRMRTRHGDRMRNGNKMREDQEAILMGQKGEDDYI